MNYLIHAAPTLTSRCLQCFNPDVTTIAIIVVFTLLLLLLIYCCCHITVATDKLHQVSYFPGVADLTNRMLRLINILWLPLCRINKFRFYFPRRLLRSSILVGHHSSNAPTGNIYGHDIIVTNSSRDGDFVLKDVWIWLLRIWDLFTKFSGLW